MKYNKRVKFEDFEDVNNLYIYDNFNTLGNKKMRIPNVKKNFEDSAESNNRLDLKVNHSRKLIRK
jgi:hypothetical protein